MYSCSTNYKRFSALDHGLSSVTAVLETIAFQNTTERSLLHVLFYIYRFTYVPVVEYVHICATKYNHH